MKMKLYYNIIDGYDVNEPIRVYKEDAGIDFYLPNFNDIFVDEFLKVNNIKRHEKFKYISNNVITIFNHEDILIPSGIRVCVPEGHALIFFNKSGVARKNKLVLGACVVDEGYSGQVYFHFYNYSNNIINIFEGMKIAQGIILKVPKYSLKQLSDSEYKKMMKKYNRQEKGFGSTQKQVNKEG